MLSKRDYLKQDAGNSKNKSRAVLIAILFGFTTWLYTYEKDKFKFWLALILSFICFISLIVAFIVVVDDFFHYLSDYFSLDNNGAEFKTSWLLSLLPAGGLLLLWVWPIIDSLRRPKSWYEKYF